MRSSTKTALMAVAIIAVALIIQGRDPREQAQSRRLRSEKRCRRAGSKGSRTT